MMKKLISLILISALVLGVLSGCGSNSEGEANEAIIVNGYTLNSAYNREKMFAIDGSEYLAKGNHAKFLEKGIGMGITLTDAMVEEKNKDDGKINGYLMDEALGVNYTPDKAKELYPSDEELKNMSDEETSELWAEVRKYTCSLFALVKIEDNNAEDTEFYERFSKKFQKVEELCKAFGYTFYFMYNDDMSGWQLTEDEKTQVSGFLAEFDVVKNNLCIFNPVEEDENVKFQGTLSDFSAETMSGKKVDQGIFKDYDITMVNVWATWCGPCAQELPEIQELYEQTPDNVNIISICTDASTETELAQSMIDENGVEFETIIDNKELEDSFYKYCEAFPTTVFVDSKGNIIGDVQVGLPGKDVVAGYSSLIDNALKLIGK
jgi:thiol-disulfide isomerase/thioredoxin